MVERLDRTEQKIADQDVKIDKLSLELQTIPILDDIDLEFEDK